MWIQSSFKKSGKVFSLNNQLKVDNKRSIKRYRSFIYDGKIIDINHE